VRAPEFRLEVEVAHAEPEPPGLTPEPLRVTVTDPQLMRALAHPARLAILEHLSSTKASATATELADVVGLSPSATSYHLRALAKWDMVEDAPSQGDARERRWRTRQTGFNVEPGRTAEPEARAAEEALLDAFLARQNEQVRRYVARAADESEEWYAAAVVSTHVLLLTAEELTRLSRTIVELTAPYRRDSRADAPSDARPLTFQLRAVPID
jgi:DNA-binding transcriptional ArsR family regulator